MALARMYQIGSKGVRLSGWKSPDYSEAAALSSGFKAEVGQWQEYKLLSGLSSGMGGRGGVMVVIIGVLVNLI